MIFCEDRWGQTSNDAVQILMEKPSVTLTLSNMSTCMSTVGDVKCFCALALPANSSLAVLRCTVQYHSPKVTHWTCLRENGAGPTALLKKNSCRIDVRGGMSTLTTSPSCQRSNNQDTQVGRLPSFYYYSPNTVADLFDLICFESILHIIYTKSFSNLGINLRWSEPNNPTFKPQLVDMISYWNRCRWICCTN